MQSLQFERYARYRMTKKHGIIFFLTNVNLFKKLKPREFIDGVRKLRFRKVTVTIAKNNKRTTLRFVDSLKRRRRTKSFRNYGRNGGRWVLMKIDAKKNRFLVRHENDYSREKIYLRDGIKNKWEA